MVLLISVVALSILWIVNKKIGFLGRNSGLEQFTSENGATVLKIGK